MKTRSFGHLSRLGLTIAIVFVAYCTRTDAAKLYGVTDDSASTNPESLFLLSQTDASSTFVGSLGNGNDGETIAYNPKDGALYHYSGFTNECSFGFEIFERIDFLGITSIDTENIPYNRTTKVLAATYPGPEFFLYSDVQRGLNRHTISTGAVIPLGNTTNYLKGLAFKDGGLYACDRHSNSLLTINENNGSTLTSKSIVLSPAGATVFACNGLATHPDTHELWARGG
jgi:DNA-binding beta-propeller fold protein YncE